MFKYAIDLNERNLDLIMFLNDGHRPVIEDKPQWLILEINGPREITSKLQFKDEPVGVGDGTETYHFIP